MRYFASLSAVLGAIATRLGYSEAVQQILWSGTMPANSSFVSSIAVQIK